MDAAAEAVQYGKAEIKTPERSGAKEIMRELP